ncbi:spore germination protein [Paenibacillus sp. strain BS8-2]
MKDINKKSADSISQTLGSSADLVERTFAVKLHNGDQAEFILCYLSSLTDETYINSTILPSLMEHALDLPLDIHRILETVRQQVLHVAEVSTIDYDIHAMVHAILMGKPVLYHQHEQLCLVIGASSLQDRGVSETQTQTVVRGPKDSFNETLATNISLVRRRIRNSKLRVRKYLLGTESNTNVSILYMEQSADPAVVAQIEQKLQQLQLKGIFEGEYIEEMLQDKQLTLFPLVYNTERPDVVCSSLIEGRVAIMVDGTPFVMIAPAVFTDFLQAAEDFYQSFVFASLIKALRILTLLIGTFAPALYIALTTFNQEVLPTQLLLSIAAQREGVPFPAFIEALLMGITFEILQEAGIRMPRSVGQAVSIVGTIVVGQAAVDAGIVSAAMVIIVSITAISSFAIPAYNLAISIRITRFLFMGAAAAFGIFGITMGAIVLIIHLCGLSSVGIPYMKRYSPTSTTKDDAVFRKPYWLMNNTRRD